MAKNAHIERCKMKAEIIITNVHPRMFGFAALADSGVAAFVPPHIVVGHNLRAGDHYTATLIPNPNADTRERTPYQAVALHVDEPSADDGQSDETQTIGENISREIIAYLKDDGGAVDTAKIAAEFSYNSRRMAAHLMHMHNKGKICRVEYWAKGTQKRASYVFWSYNLSNVLD